MSHLRTFGCRVFMKIPIDANGRQVNRGSKLDDRTIPGKFVGYLPGHAGYQILLEDGRVMKSKDVELIKDQPHRTLNVIDDDDNIGGSTVKLLTVTQPMAKQPSVTTHRPTPITPTGTVNAGEQNVDENLRIGELPPVGEYWRPANTETYRKSTGHISKGIAQHRGYCRGQ